MAGNSQVEYVQSDQFEAASYVKNAKAIGFLWGIFTICYSIISVVVFIQPQWIGSDSSGYFGLWRRCSVVSFYSESSSTAEFVCHGRLDDFSSIVSPAFRSATVLVGLGCTMSLLSVFGLILFVCSPTTVAFSIIGWIQVISALFTTVGLSVFPLGWDRQEINDMCNNGAEQFNLGTCGLRWAYILAIIGVIDGIVLAMLGFTLSSRHIKLRNDNFGKFGTLNTSRSSRRFYNLPTDESGPAPSLSTVCTPSKKSMNLQPIFILPGEIQTDSEVFRRKESCYDGEYATASQLFQL